ncbi:hypothetical protein V2H45_20515 [Tumidithrix elongata RA019]|uniref:Protein phosphatase 2C domain-containing protein n=1 Tax=Tumidithrix elongata BACA0141 TaxID=2716417 RepID=A0AAW9Q1L5_9CYAN|nr:hypothetical protein [Tumidithrix elongata RA019]
MRRRNRRSSTRAKLAKRKAASYQHSYLLSHQPKPLSVMPSIASSTCQLEAPFIPALENALDSGFAKVIRCYSINKAGGQPDECEDAYMWRLEADVCRFSVADGATESSFAKEWARQLVSQFVQASIPKTPIAQEHTKEEESHGKFSLFDWLTPLQKTWETWLANQDLLWFAKRKAEQGTYATLLGLEIDANRQWQAIAVGDSCLFVVRDFLLLHSFPLAHSREFGYRPQLLGTKMPLHDDLNPIVAQFVSHQAKAGDRFYLVTDALAAWIFASLETQKNPWVELDSINTQADFIDWVTHLRDRQEMPNDDTTLLYIQIQ